MARYLYGISTVLVWYWDGTGMVLVCDWYIGMAMVVLAWYWHGCGMVLVCYWYSMGMVTAWYWIAAVLVC